MSTKTIKLHNNREASVYSVVEPPFFADSSTFRWYGGTVHFVQNGQDGEVTTAGANIPYSTGHVLTLDIANPSQPSVGSLNHYPDESEAEYANIRVFGSMLTQDDGTLTVSINGQPDVRYTPPASTEPPGTGAGGGGFVGATGTSTSLFVQPRTTPFFSKFESNEDKTNYTLSLQADTRVHNGVADCVVFESFASADTPNFLNDEEYHMVVYLHTDDMHISFSYTPYDVPGTVYIGYIHGKGSNMGLYLNGCAPINNDGLITQ